MSASTIQLPLGGPSISYLLYQPPSPPSTPRLAMIAHPYGRLGGCKEDHVVTTLAEALAEDGWNVCTPDSRGSGESSGSGSWTGLAEAADYAHLVELVLLPLVTGHQGSVDLLLCGYSAGCLSASHSPSPSLPNITFRTRYLLVSYPLSVLWALTLFQTSPFQSALDAKARCGETPILAVYGSSDQFTGVDKYRAWAERLGCESTSLKAVELEGVDHFWRKGATRKLVGEVRRWME